MTGIDKYFLKNDGGAKGKDIEAKRRVIAQLAKGDRSIADITKALELSTPTITKLIAELIAENIVEDLGKIETAGGRRPNIFGLKDTGIHFLGAEIVEGLTTLIVTDLRGRTIVRETTKGDPLETLEQAVSKHAAVAAGICSDSQSSFFSEQFRDEAEKRLGIPVHTDSPTHARCQTQLTAEPEDMLYVDAGNTISFAVVVHGEIYYGRSGLGGQIPDSFITNDDIDTLIEQAYRGESHCIGDIDRAAERTGYNIAVVICLLNPETVVIGGPMARAGEYFMLPLQAAVHRITPTAIYRDVKFRVAEQDRYTAAEGAAALIRNITLGAR